MRVWDCQVDDCGCTAEVALGLEAFALPVVDEFAEFPPNRLLKNDVTPFDAWAIGLDVPEEFFVVAVQLLCPARACCVGLRVGIFGDAVRWGFVGGANWGARSVVVVVLAIAGPETPNC